MANDLLIQPLVIDPADFPPLPLQPGFTQLVNDELGNAATPRDGFERVLGATIAIVDGLDAALGGLAGELLNAFGEADTIDAAPVSDTVAGFTASLAPSDTAVGNLGTLLSAAAAPTPPAGGGGGGAGLRDIPATTGPVLSCSLVQPTPPGANTHLPSVQTLTLYNQAQSTLTIDSVAFVSPNAGQFTARTDIPASVPVGGSFVIEVTQHKVAALSDQGQLQITVAGQSAPEVICFVSGAISAGGGGGGTIGGKPPVKGVL